MEREKANEGNQIAKIVRISTLRISISDSSSEIFNCIPRYCNEKGVAVLSSCVHNR